VERRLATSVLARMAVVKMCNANARSLRPIGIQIFSRTFC